jgi:Asp-tRNA(Asn)/Glu-tRNA(Gln) amidotransferase B subunit
MNNLFLSSKEEANDYRYFPDPISPFDVTPALIHDVQTSIPALPEELMEDTWRSITTDMTQK